MVIDSKQKLAEYLGVTISRLDHLFNKKNIQRPENIGTHRKPLYDVDNDYIEYFNSYNKNYKVNRKIKETEKECVYGSMFINYLQKRQKEIDIDYDRTHGLLEWT